MTMRDGRRRGHGAGIIACSLLAGMLSCGVGEAADDPIHPIEAPTVGGEPGNPSAALEARIAALESRLAALEGEAGKPKPVKAPFVVVDGGGRAILTVSADGSLVLGSAGDNVTLSLAGGPKVEVASGGNVGGVFVDGTGPRLRLRAGDQWFSAGIDQGAMAVSLANGETSIDLAARSGAPLIAAFADAGRAVKMGAAQGAFGFIAASGDAPVASLSAVGGNDLYALKIYEPGGSGGPVLQAGYHSNGKPGLSLWEGDNAMARLEAVDGGGKLSLFKGSDEVVSVGLVQGAKGLVVTDGGAQVFAGMAIEAEPNVWIARDKNTLAGFEVSTKDPSAGALFVSRSNERRATLDAGPSPGLRLFHQQESALSAFVGEDGVASLLISKGKDPVALLGGSSDKPSAGGLLLFEKGDATTSLGDLGDGMKGLQVLDTPEKPAIELAIAEGTPGLSINKDGKLRAFLGMENGGDPAVAVFSESNRLGELTAEGDSGSLVLYKQGKQTISVGPTKEKPSAALRAYDKGKMVFAAGVAPSGVGALVAYDAAGQIGAGLNGYEGGGGSVYVTVNGQTAASMNSSDKPGSPLFVARNKAGVAVAMMGLSQDGTGSGGNITTADPTGFGMFSAGYATDGAGEACVNRRTQAGTDRMACVGLGLPSAGMGK